MKLRGIEFGNVFAGSGLMGFFGEGYWYHNVRLSRPLGLNFNGITLVTKTATAEFNKGNVNLKKDFTPVERFPDCVKVKPFNGVTLNAVGASNPGISVLLGQGKWQMMREPFIISIMALGDTERKREEENKTIVNAIGERLEDFHAPVALQENISCPNTKYEQAKLMHGIESRLEAQSVLDIPLIPKVSIASAPISFMVELGKNPYLSGISSSNTVPYDWKEMGRLYWGKEKSPLEKYNPHGGGIGGSPLTNLVCSWIKRLKDSGFNKPINGGGGILSTSNVDAFHGAGASSIFLCSAAMVRPHRFHKIVQYANSLDWG